MKALAFDFNGTMYMDTDKHRQAWDIFFQKYIGRPLAEEEFLHYACGPAIENIMRHFFPQVTDAARITAFAEEKEAIYRRLCREDAAGLHLIEGLPETLDRLRARGVRLALATATDRPLAEAALRRTGLLPYFSCLLTCSEVGAGKDRPDIYFAALAALSAKREETLVFEDAVHAIETAKAAGFAVAAVRDASMEAQAPRIRALADLYLDALSDFPLR